MFISGLDPRAMTRRSAGIDISAVAARPHLFNGAETFNGPETVLQRSDGDHEIAAARTQHPRENRIARITEVARADAFPQP
jgi:hypothetical protein